MLSRIGCFAFIVTLATLGGCAHPYRTTVDRVASYPVANLDALAIETDNGDVDIVTDPALSEVHVVARVTGAAFSSEEAMARAGAATVGFEPLPDGHSARLFVTFEGGRRSSEGCDFSVRMPRVAKTSIDTGNGEVRVTGTSGELDVDTSNGAVTLNGHDGDTRIETSNGTVVLTAVSGRVRAKSSNGEIHLVAGGGGVSEFDLDTSNGEVEVDLGDGFAGSIDAATSNGVVTCTRANSSIHGRRAAAVVQLGDGDRSRIRTSNGSITIR